MVHTTASTARMAMVACTLVALAGAVAAPAGSDPANVDAYLADIRSAGIPYRTPADAVDFGNGICADLRSGQSLQQVVGRVAGTGMTPDQGGPLIAISVHHLCPDQQANADAQAHAGVDHR